MKIVFCVFALVYASAVWGQTDLFAPKGLTELKNMPSNLAETVGMLKKTDLVEIKSTAADSLGAQWYLVFCPALKTQGFVPALAVEFFGDEEKGGSMLQMQNEHEEDRKRRLKALREHPDWPRRIQRVVRNGAICLKMSEEQLSVSWEQPYQKTSGFILGLGNVNIHFFQSQSPVAVILKNNEIVGWSESKKSR
ncbi:MAG: hypothetical protein A2268_12960 [Candidatus Raymondbacteria bacterium RifOxyA12_full_50_37]|uniref:Uncharacterized protein n=1 Tax=Candidatus Raymondbacteria bacterium RIFOXYD12_FULL_49_13 TaxID=1817890 RepID=A0A1F7EZS7_UNCRA|nr:MAG: hypothetical protein A2268_12960 [Candidatus Raymondbacteria bacterium RifOxyA12_full_50_37]OGJ92976.1 MAG: hypothetical protein A2248_18095 [Candidatus Raymondbacteria bacterium RIFOXYA2_FULL_49_16]OGJ97658.1 MAG: hypothetical protein A2487_13085 [Candidatus Raymondbacteria bacterium RifOxyC12_full_50_8]OGJ99890.1 MAG: hypothetical protein A2519_00075 [Candidatus Raymondbacteria bacterium RIFOXYD12_FULL_49_13]OGP40772.1 MAG: hypothetical protein A2324_03665 [Candidatus Raymondbacteria 